MTSRHTGLRTEALDAEWERLATDIHANGYSVRDAIAAHRPAIEREAAAATPSLDRESLEHALRDILGPEIVWRPSAELNPWRDYADRIAAEYARLRASTGSGKPDDDENYTEPPSPKLWEGLPATRGDYSTGSGEGE